MKSRTNSKAHVLMAAFLLMIAVVLAFSVTGSVGAQAPNVTLTVLDSDGVAFDGIKVHYNDYGNRRRIQSALLPEVSRLLPTCLMAPINLKRSRITRNRSRIMLLCLEMLHSKRSKFVIHITDSNGANFEGIAASFNDYGNHYLSMGNTDLAGKASIELFPGTHKFRASKNYSNAVGDLTNDVPGTEGTIVFQTAKFSVHVKDSTSANLSGIAASV